LPYDPASDEWAIRDYLSWREPEPGFNTLSSFWAALRDARGVVGRDQATGRLLNDEHTATWIGAVGYLSLLDQIGSAVRPIGATQTAPSSVERCLLRFAPDLTDEFTRDALYALRCALIHDYSLANNPDGRSPRDNRLRHVFALYVRDTAELVGRPNKPWDGDWENTAPEAHTRVNLLMLARLCEEIAQRVLELGARGDLEVGLPGGGAELRARYLMTWRP
jgi:hypothetical protein